MVDSHVITHLSDGLVPGLDYGPQGKTAEYVHSSKLVKFRPEAGDRYNLCAAKVIRFRLVDDCWLNSVRLQVTLNNLTTIGWGRERNYTNASCTSSRNVYKLSPVLGRAGCRAD